MSRLRVGRDGASFRPRNGYGYKKGAYKRVGWDGVAYYGDRFSLSLYRHFFYIRVGRLWLTAARSFRMGRIRRFLASRRSDKRLRESLMLYPYDWAIEDDDELELVTADDLD